jgi:hypothetical protein
VCEIPWDITKLVYTICDKPDHDWYIPDMVGISHDQTFQMDGFFFQSNKYSLLQDGFSLKNETFRATRFIV